MRKSINTNGITLSYLEKNESALKTVFFIHGNSCSSRIWEKQLDSALFRNYRLLALDLPGHGRSSASPNPEEDYSPLGTSKIISEAIQDLALEKPYLLVGFSYGANLIAEMLRYNINPIGIALVGSTITGDNYGLEKVFLQKETPSIFFYNEPNEQIVADFIKNQMRAASEIDVSNSIEDYLQVDRHFKPHLVKSVSEGKITDEIKALEALNVPVCVIFGKEDSLVNIHYIDKANVPIWRNQIFKLPGAGHWVSLENPDKFNQLLLDYISEVF